jgi:hypothetical protein
MDGKVTHTVFLTDVTGITIPHVLIELLTFANTFCTLLASTEEELNSFTKNTHSSNHFKQDSNALYSLCVQHVGTEGHGLIIFHNI